MQTQTTHHVTVHTVHAAPPAPPKKPPVSKRKCGGGRKGK